MHQVRYLIVPWYIDLLGSNRLMHLFVISRCKSQSSLAPESRSFFVVRTGSLELFLHQEIGVDQDAVLAYLSDGRRLTSSNIRELGSVQDGVC